MLNITDDNYGRFKQVFELILKFIYRDHPFLLESDASPIKVLEEWEQQSMVKAKKGLKHGLADILSQLKELSDADKEVLNKKLLAEGLTSLWRLIATIAEIPAKVLKRGKIKNLDEWYVIKEVLDTVDSDITDAEREKLEKISSEFENTRRKRKGGA